MRIGVETNKNEMEKIETTGYEEKYFEIFDFIEDKAKTEFFTTHRNKYLLQMTCSYLCQDDLINLLNVNKMTREVCRKRLNNKKIRALESKFAKSLKQKRIREAVSEVLSAFSLQIKSYSLSAESKTMLCKLVKSKKNLLSCQFHANKQDKCTPEEYNSLINSIGSSKNLESIEITSENCYFYCDALFFKNISNLENLKVLSLKKVKIDECAITNYLRGYTKLEELCIENCQIFDKALKMIFTSLKNSKNLKKLNLSENPINNLGLQALSEFLTSSNTSLEELQLNKCAIDNKGLSAFITGITTNKTLKHLSINQIEADDTMHKKLFASLINNKSLQSLEYFGNIQEYDTGRYFIEIVVPTTNITHINLVRSPEDCYYKTTHKWSVIGTTYTGHRVVKKCLQLFKKYQEWKLTHKLGSSCEFFDN